MREYRESIIWKVLNSPLIVVVVALVLWPLLSTLTASYAVTSLKDALVESSKEMATEFKGAFSGNSEKETKKILDNIEVAKKIKLESVKTAPSSWKTQEKIIGTITNNSKEIIKSINLTASFYDTSGELIDVQEAWLSKIKYLMPGDSKDFTFTRNLGSHSDPEDELAKRKGESIEVVLSDFSIVEESKDSE
ncbi:MAG: FxLYD domain-containing protein [Deltaproteobacteria bacterium]|nr:FxLYD domain-containing protein [Deltaproteobacteria bacterium]